MTHEKINKRYKRFFHEKSSLPQIVHLKDIFDLYDKLTSCLTAVRQSNTVLNR